MLELKPREELIRLAVKHNGDWEQIRQAIRSEKFDTDGIKIPTDCKAVTILDPEYPRSLCNDCPKPPFVLFYKGDLSLISDKSKCVTIVGARDASDKHLEQVRDLTKSVSELGYVIVSGTSKGVQINAINSATRPVCVLGNGFHKPYPAESKATIDLISKYGLVISEYPPDVPAGVRNFPARSRILASLSNHVICGRVTDRSGTLVTIAYASAENVDVGVMTLNYGDGAINSRLISDGMFPLGSFEDVKAFLK